MYPKELFCANELVTQENMRRYDERKRLIEKRCLELDPDYHKRNLKERYELRKKVEENL